MVRTTFFHLHFLHATIYSLNICHLYQNPFKIMVSLHLFWNQLLPKEWILLLAIFVSASA